VFTSTGYDHRFSFAGVFVAMDAIAAFIITVKLLLHDDVPY
jgi:hypothetical protein